MGNSVKKITPSNGSPQPCKSRKHSHDLDHDRRISTVYGSRSSKIIEPHVNDSSHWDFTREGSMPRRETPRKFPTVGNKSGAKISGKPPLKAASDNQTKPRSGKKEEEESWRQFPTENGGSELLEASTTMNTFIRRKKLSAVESSCSSEDVKQQPMRNVNSDRWRSRDDFSSSNLSLRQSFLNQSGKKTREISGSSNQSSDATSPPKSNLSEKLAIAASKQRVEVKERDGKLVLFPDLVENIADWYVDCGKELGRGNFGVVSVLRSKASEKEVACKTISKSRLKRRKDEEEVKKEVLVMRKLKGHPHICQLFEVFEDEKKVSLVMEYCRGKALSHQILRRKRLTEPEANHIFCQVVEAVRFVHASGVMHRDLKPENILLSVATDPLKPTSVHVKLADFGLSVFLKEGEKTSGLAGSPYYFAPEVVSGGKYGREADIWSLGVVLYVLLSGMLPFYGESDKEIFSHISEGKVVFHSKHWKGVSSEARKLVLKLLTREPLERPTAKQVLDDSWFQMFD